MSRGGIRRAEPARHAPLPRGEQFPSLARGGGEWLMTLINEKSDLSYKIQYKAVYFSIALAILKSLAISGTH